MYALVVLALSTLLATMMGAVASQYYEISSIYSSRAKNIQVVSLAENIEQYFIEKSAFPATIPALTSSAGFEHSRSMIDNWQGYAVSPAISDGVWLFNRAVLFSNNPSKGVNSAAYLSANACGIGGYDTAAGWCGAATGQWFRRESRERYTEQIATQRVRLNRLLQKLADYYNTNQGFPDRDAGGAALAADSTYTLAALSAFGGAAGACSGTYTYMNIPIDCGDIFDLWGQPVGYQFVSSKHIILVSETPIFNSGGGRVVIGADFDNTQL